MASRLQDHYKNKVVSALTEKLGCKNVHEVPKLEKIVVSMGVSTAASKADKTAVAEAAKELGAITGQKPVINLARKSIAQFNLREGQEIGCRVTLRGKRMYEFLDRLVSAALPRIRDFRGVSNRSFDGRGSYTFGINDQTIFPEIDLDKIKRQQGMHITFVTSARSDVAAKALLSEMGIPFMRPSATAAPAKKG